MEDFENLEVAYAGVAVVQQATGVMMVRHDCGADEGFTRLCQYAEDSGATVEAAASEVVRQSVARSD